LSVPPTVNWLKYSISPDDIVLLAVVENAFDPLLATDAVRLQLAISVVPVPDVPPLQIVSLLYVAEVVAVPTVDWFAQGTNQARVNLISFGA